MREGLSSGQPEKITYLFPVSVRFFLNGVPLSEKEAIRELDKILSQPLPTRGRKRLRLVAGSTHTGNEESQDQPLPSTGTLPTPLSTLTPTG